MKCPNAFVPVLLVVSVSIADECDPPGITPFPSGSESWIDVFQDSIDRSKPLHTSEVPGDDPQWQRLRTMPDHAPVQFASWTQPEDEWQLGTTQIEQPVLVVTWSFSTLPNASGSIAELLETRRTMQEYVTSDQDGPATLWFTVHGNAFEYLDELGIDRSCFNMSSEADATELAILWGVPTVGVPFAFQQCELPYADVAGAWWREYMLIGVADRRAFVRPSYNPCVRPESESVRTNDGVPLWSDHFNRYALADAATDPDVHAAQQAAINGPAPFEFKAYDLDGTPETDFSEWIRKWGEDSWVPARQPGNSGVNGFPYSGIGITGNWLAAGPEPALPADSFLALSEFILKADAPIYWLGVRSASQYFGVPDSKAGQVSWCDSCLGDIDMSGAVDAGDLLMLIEGWGTRNPGMLFGLGDSASECSPSEVMPEVGIKDLLWLIRHWGPCNGWPEGLESLRPADCD